MWKWNCDCDTNTKRKPSIHLPSPKLPNKGGRIVWISWKWKQFTLPTEQTEHHSSCLSNFGLETSKRKRSEPRALSQVTTAAAQPILRLIVWESEQGESNFSSLICIHSLPFHFHLAFPSYTYIHCTYYCWLSPLHNPHQNQFFTLSLPLSFYLFKETSSHLKFYLIAMAGMVYQYQ
jgi:hypothetical protein